MVASAKSAKAMSAELRRLSAEDRRRQIVQAAIELFARKGFNGTTTKEIARAAGVSEALIFRHFPTKQDLYSAIIDHKMKECRRSFQEELREAMAHRDDRAFFTRLAEEILQTHREDPSFIRLMLFSALEGHELSRMVYETYVTEMFEELVAYIARRVRERAFRAVNPRVAARAFVGMIAHHALARALFDPSERLLNLDDTAAARAFATIFLDGIARRARRDRSSSRRDHDQ
ncbi:MAG: TetR/AcrR family transcriptional regulator [Blastocatellia bacterium]|nr:TetR/AcrR family transcriptional regulator [Blastocatellia bacterium]